MLGLQKLKTSAWGFIFAALLANTAAAQEETSVLPKGVFRTWVIGAYGGTEYQFNSRGRHQNLAHILNRSVTMQQLQEILSLDPENKVNRDRASKITLLRNELNNFGTEMGISNLGDNLYQADVYADARVEASQLVYALEYGLSHRVSLGIALPMQWYNIRSRVRIQNLDSYMAANETMDDLLLEENIREFAKIVEDTNTLKKEFFGANGYQEPADTHVFGIGDMEGGIKFRAFESQYVDSALLLGFRLPTASHKKNPSNLLDQATGDGQFDLAIQGALDFKLTSQLTFLTALKYTFQSPDTEPVVSKLLGTNVIVPNLNDPRVRDDDARRKLGDIFDVNLNLRYAMFQKKFTAVGAYIYQFKNADSYSGDNPFLDYSFLEKDTQRESHALEFFLIYSTVADYFRKEKAIPWEASVTYHHTLSGINTPDLRYAYARVKFFFN